MKKFLAVMIAILCVNTLCFFYYNPLHGSAHNSYRVEPNTIGMNLVEGIGVMYADKNGFSNKPEPLIEEDYILVMGSSHSKADQLFVEDRYSSLLNRYLGYDKELGVYNLAYNGGKLDDIVKNFQELITESPNSKAIIIEATDSQLQLEESDYLDAMDQIRMEDSVTGERLSQRSITEKVKFAVKKYCPLLLLYVNQYTQWKNAVNSQENSTAGEEPVQIVKEAGSEEYQRFSDMMELL